MKRNAWSLKNFQAGLNFELFGRFAHKLNAARKFVHISDVGAAPGNKLVVVAACAAEEIEHFYIFEIKEVIENIEHALLA